ncbi:MAG: O-antigen ligase family protein [Acidimicrobiales bacterium]
MLFLGFGGFWLLGLHSFAWQICALPLLGRLVLDRRLRVPRGMGLWFVFLGWNLLTVVQLDRSSQLIGFFYRYSLYLSATIVFVFVYNAPRTLLSMRRVYAWCAALWIATVTGGWLGVLIPSGGFRSGFELVLPERLTGDPFVQDLIHPSFAQVQQFLGYPLGRPQAPFAYTNHWGAAFAMLTPVVLLGWAHLNARKYPLATQLLLTVSLVPAVVSLNRGMFLSLGVALVYASARSGRIGANARRSLLAVILLTVVLLATTPLGNLAVDREDNQHSNTGRTTLYGQALDFTFRSPVLGYGAPQEVEGDLLLPPVGTQGQFWLVMVSTGFVGLFFYVGFLIVLLVRTRRLSSDGSLAHLLIIVALVQMFVYDLLTAPHHIVFLVAAAALRDGGRDRERDERPRMGVPAVDQ